MADGRHFENHSVRYVCKPVGSFTSDPARCVVALLCAVCAAPQCNAMGMENSIPLLTQRQRRRVVPYQIRCENSPQHIGYRQVAEYI